MIEMKQGIDRNGRERDWGCGCLCGKRGMVLQREKRRGEGENGLIGRGIKNRRWGLGVFVRRKKMGEEL